MVVFRLNGTATLPPDPEPAPLPTPSAEKFPAAMATAGYTGFLVGPPLIGALAELSSLRVGLAVLAVCGVVIVTLGRSVDAGESIRAK